MENSLNVKVPRTNRLSQSVAPSLSWPASNSSLTWAQITEAT